MNFIAAFDDGGNTTVALVENPGNQSDTSNADVTEIATLTGVGNANDLTHDNFDFA